MSSKRPDFDYTAPGPLQRAYDSAVNHGIAIRRYRSARIISTGLAVAYPIILGVSDHFLPSGNLPIDIGKYSLAAILGGVATRYHVLATRRKDTTNETYQQFLKNRQDAIDELKRTGRWHGTD